ncbi:MAG: MFS transporter [Burkholderiales bacterium]|nr:MFS transporter [Burkholderiales bacterium]
MKWKIDLAIFTTCAILMSMSYTMLIPFLPMYLIQDLGVQKEDVDLWSGLIFAVTFLISGIMAPIWGALADRKSRKLMAIRAGFCLSIAYFLGGLVTGPWQLFGVRVFQGLAAGLWPALLAIISATVPARKLGFCLGVLQGAMTGGGVLGPLFGGLLAEGFGMRSTFFIAGTALFIITCTILFYIQEPKRTILPNAKPVKVWDFSLLKIPAVKRALICAGVVNFTILMQQPIMPLYVAQLQGSMDKIVLVSGIVFSICGVSGVLASPIWGILGQSWSFRNVLYVSLLGSGIFGIIQVIPNSLTAFTAWRFVGGLAFAGIFPAINAVLTLSTEANDRGRVFGLSYLAQQLGAVMGPVVGGAMAAWFSYKFILYVAGGLLLPMCWYLWMNRPKTGKLPAAAGHPLTRS